MHIVYIIAIFCFIQVGADDALEPRVVKGNRTKVRKHPYSAFILVFQIIGGHMCGGSIVSQKIILTAAHCFESVTRNTVVSVNVGSSHFKKGRKILAESLKLHPRYNSIKITNDIALVGLKDSIVFGKKVKKVILAIKRPRSGIASVAGWGLIQEVPTAMYTTHLHEVSQRFISRKECKKIIKDLQVGTLCGGKRKDKSYPSTGDSGSALVIHAYKQIGLVSYKNSYLSRSLIVYTDVAYYNKWIVDNAKSLHCKNYSKHDIRYLSSDENSAELLNG